MKTHALSVIVAVSLAALACSEAQSDDGEGGAGDDGSTSTGTTTSGGLTNGPAKGAGGGGSGDLVVNEISGADDWVELYNRGDTAMDLGGLLLADQDTPGVPKLDEAISFPAGTSIAAGAYLFILVKQETVNPGEAAPQTMCAPGPSPCFYAPFGISASDGDAIFIIDGETVLANADFPPGAAGDTQSYCRLPDGGTLAPCTPTPGAANAAP